MEAIEALVLVGGHVEKLNLNDGWNYCLTYGCI